MGYDYGYDIVQEARRTNRLLVLLIRIVLRLVYQAGMMEPNEIEKYREELKD